MTSIHKSAILYKLFDIPVDDLDSTKTQQNYIHVHKTISTLFIYIYLPYIYKNVYLPYISIYLIYIYINMSIYLLYLYLPYIYLSTFYISIYHIYIYIFIYIYLPFIQIHLSINIHPSTFVT